MSAFKNSKKASFLDSIPTSSIETESDKLTYRCKFNFHYMDFSQEVGQHFSDWNHNKLVKLLEKLKNYSEASLNYWTNQRIGSKNNKVLEIYESFPKNTKFTHPKFIPHEAHWARFRLESADRLIGFVLPPKFDDKLHDNNKVYGQSNKRYDCNTFYVVFLDENHKFYLTK